MTLLTMLRRAVAPAPPPTGTPTAEERIARLEDQVSRLTTAVQLLADALRNR